MLVVLQEDLGDTSDHDKKFAENAELKFFTYEEFFYSSFTRLSRNIIHPSMTIDDIEILTVVILIGCPASGKSTYATTVLKDYYRINRDSLGTMFKCLKEGEAQLALQKSIVIDNLNKDEVSREPFIKLGQRHKCRIIAIHFVASIASGMFYNKNRSEKIPNVVFFSYRKKVNLLL